MEPKEPKDRKRSEWPVRIGVAIVGLPVLYVLSVGPVCWLTSRMNIESSALPAIYWPITEGLDVWGDSGTYSGPVDRCIRWYAGLAANEYWEWCCYDQDEDGNVQCRWRSTFDPNANL